MSKGYFGGFGGQYVPETLMWPLEELVQGYDSARKDPVFRKTLAKLFREYVGRPTPLYYAAGLTKVMGKGRIYLKREDLCLTGAHKINNCVGQLLLARRMKKTRIIAETGAGQHGVATATACALFGLECDIYMGAQDIERQALNVTRMKLLGARVRPVYSGSRTLKDACNEAIRDWVTNIRTTHYVIGSVVGPHPYPTMVRDFQSVIGIEARRQVLKTCGRLPRYLIACVGGGSNAIGLFSPFFKDRGVRMIGVEAAGKGLSGGLHSATLSAGTLGVLHGSMSYLLQNAHGQVKVAHSISAGLDYPGVGPEHAYYKEQGRARYVSVTNAEALKAFKLLSRVEGLLPALESSHAVAYLVKMRSKIKKNDIVIVNLSGRGDKDVEIVEQALKMVHSRQSTVHR